MNKKTLLLVLLFYVITTLWLMGLEIKPLRQFQLSQSANILIENARSFIVTEDNIIIAADNKAANIKIFDMTGKRVSIFGRKGMGPNEFVRPFRIAYLEPFVSIKDSGRNMIFIYKRSGLNGLESIHKILYLDLGFDFCFLDDGNFLISGAKYDKNRMIYCLYSLNIKEKEYDFILPSYVAFGYTTEEKFLKERSGKLSHIGLARYNDFSDDSIYTVWKGDLKILKINRKNGKINHFGKKTSNYVKPYSSPEIKRAFQRMDHRLLWKLARPMSMIRDIFVTGSNKVGLVYSGPFNKDGTLPVMLQLYTGSGDFLKEVEVFNARVSHHKEISFYFRKSDNRFYIINIETSAEFDQYYILNEFQVEE